MMTAVEAVLLQRTAAAAQKMMMGGRVRPCALVVLVSVRESLAGSRRCSVEECAVVVAVVAAVVVVERIR
jgi:hypothetical protein